jgi:hypothetical protein
VPTAPLYNDLVLSAIARMPHGGGYATTPAAFQRLSDAVSTGGKLLEVHTRETSPSFCSSATYLVFASVIGFLQEQGRVDLTADAICALGVFGQPDGAGVWGRWNANGPGTGRLFFELGMGSNFVEFDRAMPGDFMKIFWNDQIGLKERGHSVVYLGRDFDPNGGEKVRFWSSGAPAGYGEVSVPRSKIKRALFSRLEHPERIADAARLPPVDAYLADMLVRPGTEEEMLSMVGASKPVEKADGVTTSSR